MKRISTALDYAVAFGLFIFFFDTDAMAQTLDWFGNRRGYYEPPIDLAPLRVFLIVLSGTVGFGLGWFLSPQGKQYRLAVAAILVGLLLLTVIADNGLLGWGLVLPMSIAAFMAGFGYWARGAVERFMTPPKIFGDSEWASNEELEEAGLFEPKGIRLGYRDVNGEDRVIYYNGDRHLGTTAPSRYKKGTSVIIPNLLTYVGSCVVTDPKGENALVTAEHRRAVMGQEVYTIDPWMTAGMKPSCYNPLDALDTADIDMADDAMLLADAMIVASEKDPFWTDEAKAILHGLIGYVVSDPEEAGRRHLGRVRDLCLLQDEALIALFKNMLESPHHFVRSAGARCLQKEEKLLSNVMATLQSQTHFLDSPRVRDSLIKSDFSFADLKTKPMTIYLVIPSDKLDSHGRFLRLLIQQSLMINARNIEIQPEQPVLFILDELPALGYLSMVEKAFGLMAGYGIQIWAIAQDLNQMKRIYRDGAETFISNAGVIQYFGSRDKFTADYFSSLCGVKTVWNFSSAIGKTFGRSTSSGQSASTSESVSDSETATYTTSQCQLAYPDQLMRMDKGKQLLFVENMNPIIADKVPWFEDAELHDKGVNLHAEQAKQTAAE
ncbi:MAG: type IV secretory system conjugative DNA transfer family protein [Cohaesibacter sp.]|nr:type IV secretory system conjugative DNA transfer family protein [Cohaesibacter sp.]